jgi:hypothetical protein
VITSNLNLSMLFIATKLTKFFRLSQRIKNNPLRQLRVLRAEDNGEEEDEDDKEDENDKASEKVDAEAYFKLHLELTELKTNDDTY